MVASAEGEPNAPVRARPGARPHKSAAAFRTISEVAGELDVAQHVLRFWERRLEERRSGNHRYAKAAA
jgi:transposase-like protein